MSVVKPWEICAEKQSLFFVFIGGGIKKPAPNNQAFILKNKMFCLNTRREIFFLALEVELKCVSLLIISL
jgi:hypothetical protein